MAQVINTNVQSLNAQRNLNNSAVSLATSLQRLSSGLRINSAKDDAAGLAISERFSTQIRGLNVAVRNANDGISLSQTAEGALGEISSNLQRIRELAVQARNATNSASDRAALNAEVQQRLAEIDRTASQTSFNGQKILDGSFGNATFQVGSNAGETIGLSLATSTRLADIGKIATATSNALGNAATGGNIQVDNNGTLNFSTGGQAATSGTITVNAGTRLFGTNADAGTDGTAVVDFLGSDGAGDTDFSGVTEGINAQSIAANYNGTGTTFDFTGVGNLAQFDVDGIGVTLTGNYANGGALATAIENQLNLNGGTYDVNFVDGNLTFTETGSQAAVAITNADANSGTLGIVNSAGVAGAGGGVGATFTVDGAAVALDQNYADANAVAADLQSQLDTAFGTGSYTVVNNAGEFTITNTENGSGAVSIVATNAGAIRSGFTFGTSTAGDPVVVSNEATFNVDGFAITLTEDYTSFDDLANGTAPTRPSLQAQLDTAAGAGVYTVSNNNGAISITKTATGSASTAVTITGANSFATAAGFGNSAGTAGQDQINTTNATFKVDGQQVSLTGNYANQAALASAIQSQLTGYTVTDNAGVLTIENNVDGSAAVQITDADANATAAGFGNAVGTAGVGSGTVTLAAGALTLKGATGDAVDFAGNYANAQGLADNINSKLSGVFASITTDGKLKLQSAQEFTVGGTQAAALGLTVGTDPVDNGALSSVNVLTTTAADEAITRVDSALQSISSLRSDFGAIQNRFESTIANLQGTAENLSASRSRILDADFAAETANLTRAQILQQAGVAILSQANQLPQNVLSLLR